MVRLVVFLLFIGSFSGLKGQMLRGLDKSPMDMAYYPDNFAHDRRNGEKAIVRVVYSRPQKQGREVFGELVPFDKVWRTGANEVTEIKIYQDIEVDGQKLPAGVYSLFSIPGKTEWTIIFSNDLDFWGSYSYDKSNDVLRVKANSEELSNPVEAFTIQFEKAQKNQAIMNMAWDNVIVKIPFEY